MKDSPRRWLEGVTRLVDAAAAEPKVVFNMPGWVKGMGLEATKAALAIIQGEVRGCSRVLSIYHLFILFVLGLNDLIFLTDLLYVTRTPCEKEKISPFSLHSSCRFGN